MYRTRLRGYRWEPVLRVDAEAKTADATQLARRVQWCGAGVRKRVDSEARSPNGVQTLFSQTEFIRKAITSTSNEKLLFKPPPPAPGSLNSVQFEFEPKGRTKLSQH
ncbi:hypothetical protein C8F04DRAFT_1176413 [Mycena alexandri]|uniref:Uncharacterized protein n=1 Tax=Mycena alexandri TaxID=1745969 RepID=A0AAD6TAW9_9AGAR|nr:hypothetical protein C8F04DRAFT_1176413 [Mycena alexandri]